MKDKLVDALLADFQSLKSEIGRRSNLQRFYIGLLIGSIGFIGSSIIRPDPTWSKSLLCFPVSLVFLIIYIREDIEIHRLGEIIKDEISATLEEKLSFKGHLFPSETYRGTAKKRNFALYTDLVSLWMLFFFGPFLLTILPFISVSFDMEQIHTIFNMTPMVLRFILCLTGLSGITVVMILILFFPYKPYKK